MTEEISQLSANMKNEAANLSKIFEELRKESQSMLTRRREMIEEDRSHRAVNVPALRKQQERTSKIVELAHAIVTECNQYQQENCSILDAMESHDQDVFEKNITDLETWESAFQGLEDVAMEALSAMNETNSKTADLSSSRKFSIPCVLKEIASTASQLNKSVKKETDTFMAGIQSLNKSSYDDVKNFMISIGQYCNELRNLTCETENKRLVTQKEEANREQNIVQTVRDHLGNINEYVTSMTDEHWLHPQSSGKTPKKVHRQVASDDDIPRVPKMRKILESNGFYTEVFFFVTRRAAIQPLLIDPARNPNLT
ncbi:hypothetical protein NECAME_15405 [Necator americanus]|uniref:Uncharacterized protein n=1 Tax=Necator americanus TaxID=51031 RepID=W2SI23_NECAM|nr:hypothetical protein NECAME_15405 [Necator americanus]ETN69279.1 hypothetical protein NECAME_15405 [Necator americanus]